MRDIECYVYGNKIITRLTFAEVDANLEGDTRRMMREEREALQAAVHSGDGRRITAAVTEARRVADMWGVRI